MVIAKRNYKFYADFGLGLHLLVKKLTVLDTGAGPNFVRKDELPPNYMQKLRPAPLLKICDANRNLIRTCGVIDLMTRIGTRLVRVEFVVCERLAAGVVLGCDFMDRFVEAIYPRRKTIELDDGSSVPITRRPLRRPPNSPPLLASQEYAKTGGRSSPQVRVARPTVLDPGKQTFIMVTSARHRFMVLQPHEKLYQQRKVVASNGIVQVEPNRAFRVLMANFGSAPYRLVKGQTIGTLLPHPTAVIASKVSIADMLGLTEEEGEELQQEIESAPGGDNHSSKGTNVDETDLTHVEGRYLPRIRALLRKYSSMWSGELGEIKVTEHHIDVLPGTRPIAQNPYRAGPRAREAEREEVERMLQAGVIEPSKSAWASPVVLVPKKDGKLRFCIDYRRLNAVTIRDYCPLPRMDEYIDSLGEATVFTTLDCNSV